MVGKIGEVCCEGGRDGRKESGGLRRGLKNVTHVNAAKEKKGMSIIDSDDPSRMAVLPRGEMVSRSQPESLLWGKVQGWRWRCAAYISLSHTHAQSTYLPCNPTHPLPIRLWTKCPESRPASLIYSICS